MFLYYSLSVKQIIHGYHIGKSTAVLILRKAESRGQHAVNRHFLYAFHCSAKIMPDVLTEGKMKEI